MLRKFKIKIDGQEYLVEMEEIGGVPAPASVAPAAPAAPAPAPEAALTPAPAAQGVTPAGDDAIEAPMPGKILDIFITVGQEVQENEKLLILEAMKMENEIVATKTGVVTGIHVAKGDNVDSSTPLVTIG